MKTILNLNAKSIDTLRNSKLDARDMSPKVRLNFFRRISEVAGGQLSKTHRIERLAEKHSLDHHYFGNADYLFFDHNMVVTNSSSADTFKRSSYTQVNLVSDLLAELASNVLVPTVTGDESTTDEQMVPKSFITKYLEREYGEKAVEMFLHLLKHR